MRRGLLLAGSWLVLLAALPAQARELPLPPSWALTSSYPLAHDYSAGLTDADSHDGKSCGFLRSGLKKPKGWGDVSQAFKADRFRGNRLRWSVWYKQIAVRGKVTLWMRVEGPNHTVQAYGRYVPEPKKEGWQPYHDEFNIAPNAERIAVGVMLEGEGVVCFDDMKFDTLKGLTKTGPRSDFEK